MAPIIFIFLTPRTFTYRRVKKEILGACFSNKESIDVWNGVSRFGITYDSWDVHTVCIISIGNKLGKEVFFQILLQRNSLSAHYIPLCMVMLLRWTLIRYEGFLVEDFGVPREVYFLACSWAFRVLRRCSLRRHATYFDRHSFLRL